MSLHSMFSHKLFLAVLQRAIWGTFSEGQSLPEEIYLLRQEGEQISRFCWHPLVNYYNFRRKMRRNRQCAIEIAGHKISSDSSHFCPSCPNSCHRRHTRLPATLAQLGLGPEHRDGCVAGHHAEPLITPRWRDHPQEGGPTDEKQVGAPETKWVGLKMSEEKK